jgi:hypothetical protein
MILKQDKQLVMVMKEVKKVIEATSRPAASDAHPMGSSGGELTAASALRGSVIDGMSLTRPGGGPATADTNTMLASLQP